MALHHVTDRGSNAPENIEHAVTVIGRSEMRRLVFKAVHTGRKQKKTVDDLAKELGKPRQQVLNAAGQLANQGLVHREKSGRRMLFAKDPFYQANRDKVLRLVKNPDQLKKMPTKRRPQGTQGATILQVPVPKSRIQAKAITLDDITSFEAVRKLDPGEPVTLSEAAIKEGIRRILKVSGEFKDWGGERNDFLTDRLAVRGRNRVAAFALKGPGTKGALSPAKMGKNGDQIQRLAASPAQVLVVQYHGQVSDSVREQLALFAQLKSVWENRPIWYCIIDGDATSRLVAAYPKAFGTDKDG